MNRIKQIHVVKRNYNKTVRTINTKTENFQTIELPAPAFELIANC